MAHNSKRVGTGSSKLASKARQDRAAMSASQRGAKNAWIGSWQYTDNVHSVNHQQRGAKAVSHIHGQHTEHVHSAVEYANHQQPIDNEVVATAVSEPSIQVVRDICCPTCLAGPGETCRSASGGRLSTEHAARRELLLLALSELEEA